MPSNFDMIKLKAQLVLVVVWATCFSKVRSDVYPGNLTAVDECRRMCSESDETKPATSCVKECLLKAKDNVNATTPPLTPKLSLNFTMAASISPTTVWKYSCPRDYGPGPSEVLPGEVSGVTVTFSHETKVNSKGWVARVNWTAPKDANVSLNWRGYLVIWVSSDSPTSEPQPAYCKLVHKNQLYLDINETDGWKYPDNIYIVVVALPSKRDRFEMIDFDPRTPEWSVPNKIRPLSMQGHKRFQVQSPEGIAILIVACLITVFVILWLVNVFIVKRKSFEICHEGFKCADEKKAGKKKDELKEGLIV